MGLLRLFLALSVIAGHAKTSVFGFYGIGAWYAVNFFFIISGFYMAMVLNEKYKETPTLHFYKSRVWRLFPVYYIGIAIAAVVSYDAIVHTYSHLSNGAKLYFILQNVFIFGQDMAYMVCASTTSNDCASSVTMSMNPPAWSLAVELGFYLVAPFIVKDAKKIFLYVLFGCSYLLSIRIIQFPMDSVGLFRAADMSAFNYFFYPSSFIFFGGGALAYHLSKMNSQPHYFAAVTIIFLLSFTQTIMPYWHLLFISLAIPKIFHYTSKNRLDRVIGDLSYPAYILHFPILQFLRPFSSSNPQYFGFIELGSWVAIASCVFGLVIYLTIEKRVNKYRESGSFFENHFFSGSVVSRVFRNYILSIYFALPIAIVIYTYTVSPLKITLNTLLTS